MITAWLQRPLVDMGVDTMVGVRGTMVEGKRSAWARHALSALLLAAHAAPR